MVQEHRPKDFEQLRDTVSQLTHELAEALTATDGYLQASRHLETRSDPATLHEAIGKAIEQIKRAGEIVAKLRSLARP